MAGGVRRTLIRIRTVDAGFCRKLPCQFPNQASVADQARLAQFFTETAPDALLEGG